MKLAEGAVRGNRGGRCAAVAGTPSLRLLMGLATTFIAGLLNRHRWIAYTGLAIIVYVTLSMIWEGWHEVEPVVVGVVG